MGYNINEKLENNFDGLIVLYRGVQMEQSQVQKYDDLTKNGFESVRLSGNTSCSLNLKVALMFAMKKAINSDKK